MFTRLKHLRHGVVAGCAFLLLLPLWLREGRTHEPGEPLAVWFSQATGYYDSALRLEMTTDDPTATIYFTLDGSVPAAATSALYHSPLFLSPDAQTVIVVRARVIRPDGEMGPVATASYFMGLKSTIPVISLVVEPEGLWGEHEGIFSFPDARGRDWERLADVVYLDEQHQVGWAAAVGIRLHGGVSRWTAKKSLRLYFRSEYGLPSLEYPLFPHSSITNFKRLVLHAGGQDKPDETPNGTLLRNALMTKLGQELDVVVTQTRPVFLYLNGQFWGVYNLRERPDRFFFADHFGIAETDFLGAEFYSPDPMEGDWDNWKQLATFVQTHDLAEADNYAYVIAQIDVNNYIDYLALQIYSANTDWPKNNHDRFRSRAPGGKWHWLLWDTDFAFGLAPYSDVQVDMMAWLFSNDELLQQESLLFRQLMANPAFQTAFVTRMAELLNTQFHPDAVVAQIDALEALYAPAMAVETVRWPSVGNWAAGVEQMREFARQRPELVRQHLLAYLGQGALADILLAPPGAAAFPPSPPVIIRRYGVDSPAVGDWIELEVQQSGGVDLRGWRLSDNDSLTANDEGSLVFAQVEALADVPNGTRILLVATASGRNAQQVPEDVLHPWSGQWILYVGNGYLDTTLDPWFNLGPQDNLFLAAPGATDSFADDEIITTVAWR